MRPAVWARDTARQAGFALLLMLPAVYGLAEPWGRDHGIFAAAAAALRNGIPLYSGVFELKPPLTVPVWTLADLLFGPAMWGIRALDLFFLAATGLALRAVALRLGLGGPAASAAALFFTVLHGSLDYWHRAQPDGWASLPLALAVLAALRGRRAGGGVASGALLAAGGFLGLAFLLKYTAVLPALALLPLLGRSWVRGGLLLAAGGLAPLLAAALLLAASGALGAFVEAQAFALRYAGVRAAAPVLAEGFLLAVAGAPGIALLALALPFARRTNRPALLLAVPCLWLLGAVLGAVFQGKGFVYHYAPVLPALALLAAATLSALRPSRVAAIAALACLASLAAVRSVETLRALAGHARLVEWQDARFRQWNFAVADVRAAAAALNRTDPVASLYVWGYDAMLYPLTATLPRHRYLYPGVIASDPALRADLLARLAADPPLRFVVQHGDRAPHVTGHGLDSASVLDGIPALRAFLAGRYCPPLRVAGFDLHRLRDGDTCPE